MRRGPHLAVALVKAVAACLAAGGVGIQARRIDPGGGLGPVLEVSDPVTGGSAPAHRTPAARSARPGPRGSGRS
ncbi:MAG: hypothetical protein ACRDPC_11445 [Solirubrobacteraceae bacterium]